MVRSSFPVAASASKSRWTFASVSRTWLSRASIAADGREVHPVGSPETAVRVEQVQVHEPGLGSAAEVLDEGRYPPFVPPLRHHLSAFNVCEAVGHRVGAEQPAYALVDPLGNGASEEVGLVVTCRITAARRVCQVLPSVVRGVEPAHVGIFGVGVVTHPELKRRVAQSLEEHGQRSIAVRPLQQRRRKRHVGSERQPAGEECDERTVRARDIGERVLEKESVFPDAPEKRRRRTLVAVRRRNVGVDAVDPKKEDIRSRRRRVRVFECRQHARVGQRRQFLGAYLWQRKEHRAQESRSEGGRPAR
jgi:hypothetical protein